MLWNSSALYSGSTSSVQNDIRINSFLVGFLRILLRFGQLNADFLKWKSTSRTNRPHFPLLLRTLLAYALKTRYYWGLLATRVNPYTIGCVWTGELDLTTLRVDGKILNLERKSCGFKTIRIRVDKDLKYIVHFHAKCTPDPNVYLSCYHAVCSVCGLYLPFFKMLQKFHSYTAIQ